MRYTPAAEIAQRVARLQSRLVAENVDCVLLRQNVHLYYFSGTIQNAHLFIPASGEPLLLARRDFFRARLESPLERVAPLHSLKAIPGLLADHGIAAPGQLGLELDSLPAIQYLNYGDLFPATRLVDVSTVLRQTRGIKSPWEVERIEEAAAQADLMFRTARDTLREGMREIELAAAVEHVARLNGHQGLIRMRAWNAEQFYGYLVSGANAAVPSHLDALSGGVGLSPALGHGSSARRIQSGEPVYFDLTGWIDGYHADLTRIIVPGKPSDHVRRLYDDMRTVYRRLSAAVRPGVRAGDVYAVGTAAAKELGHADHFMGYGDTQARYVGHGVGLELDEPPPLARGASTLIEEGMVLALEPKVIVPGLGAIGIENTNLVTKDGLRQLTFSDEALAVV